MPEVVENIDVIASRLGRPVLLASFGRDDALPGLDGDARAVRARFLRLLDGAGVTWTPCGPPTNSGWLSYLGDVYFSTAYAPGEESYERLRRLFENDAGELLDPKVRFRLYAAPEGAGPHDR